MKLLSCSVEPRFINRISIGGFTLIELLISLCIMLLLASTGYPAMSGFYAKYNATSDAEFMFTLLQRARTEAIVRQGYMTICASSDLVKCDSNWQQSIILFNDHNKNQIKEPKEELLLVAKPSKYMQANRPYLLFSPFSQANNITGTLSFCLKNKIGIRALVISNVGRVRVETDRQKIKCRS